MYSLHDPDLFDRVVSQFGNLRVKAHVRLTAAYRRLSRPSSAPDAKASALCSFQLELYYGISSVRFSLLVFILELLESRKQLFRLHITIASQKTSFSACFTYRHFHDEIIVFYPRPTKKPLFSH